MKINCGYRYRIYPTKEQAKILDHYFFVSNQAYNICLDYQKETWERNRELPKKDRTYPKAAEIDAIVKNALNNRGIHYKTVITQQARIHASDALMRAITNKKFGFPQFKNSKLDSQSFSWNNQHCTLTDRGNPKFKTLNVMQQEFLLRYHRDLPEKYKLYGLTISRRAGRYYASFNIEYEKDVVLISKENLDIKRAVGIDINVENIAFSNGFKLMTKSKLIAKTKYDKKIKRLKGKQSRRILRSKNTKTPLGRNFKKCQKKVCRIYDRASSIKRDSLHKISNAIVNNFDAIAVEDLTVKDMTVKKQEGITARQARAYNRAVRDASFYCLLNFIEYKAKRNGKMLAKIDPAYTSKTCHRCNHINYNLTVNDRIFNCPSCGLVMDRDEQSSINIHNIGMKSLGLGISLQTINVKPFKIVKLSSLQLGSSHLFR